MLGLLVGEFVNMVEARFGEAVAEAVLFGTEMPDDLAATQPDRYPAAQMQVLIDTLARRVDQAPHGLMQALAGRVVRRIRLVNPDVFARHADLFGQIAASDEDVVLGAYEVDECDVQEVELLLGERAAAQALVTGLLADLARCGRGSRAGRVHRAQPALSQVRALMR